MCQLCGQPVTDGHMAEHLANECPHRQVFCEYCHAEVIFAHMQVYYVIEIVDDYLLIYQIFMSELKDEKIIWKLCLAYRIVKSMVVQ